MKTLKTILLFLPFLLFNACSKDDVNNITPEAISEKWEINSTSGVQSIEFNESKSYIVVELDANLEENTYYGIYQIDENTEIRLTGFGTMTDLDLANNNLSFSITRLDGTIDAYNSTAADETIASSANSNDLSRTWNLISSDGELVAGTDEALHVVFSQAGTYFVTYLSGFEDNFNSQWMWKDNTEETLCYSHDGPPVCDEDQVTIVELSASKLLIDEDGVEYLLEPI